MKKLKFHPVSELFPLIEGQAFTDLVSDIKKNGLQNSILLHPDGSIIDGRNRYLACDQADVEPRFKNWNGKGSLIEKVISLNLHRRHLTESQRGMIASQMMAPLEEEAKERQRAGGKEKGSANLHEADKGRSSEKAAELMNVSARTVDTATKVARIADPEVVKAVKSGKISVSAAKDLAQLPKAKQKKIVKKNKQEIQKEVKKVRDEYSNKDVQIFKRLKKAFKELDFLLDYIIRNRINFRGIDATLMLADMENVYKKLGKVMGVK